MSAEILADMGLNNVEVVGDPVLAFADDFLAASTEAATLSLGLNVGHSRGQVWGSEETICEQFVQLAKMAKHHGCNVHWFVVWDDDLQTTLRVAQASGTAERVYQIYDDPVLFLNLARPLTAFVGMKLHAVVLATCAYVPSLMVEYRPKCRDYMRSINQEGMTIRSDQFDGIAAWERVKSWESRRHETCRNLYESIRPLAQFQRARAEEISRKILMQNSSLSPSKPLEEVGQIRPLPRTREGIVE
jgi:polysaccharide pyruvyl transferase WcaK-like protein